RCSPSALVPRTSAWPRSLVSMVVSPATSVEPSKYGTVVCAPAGSFAGFSSCEGGAAVAGPPRLVAARASAARPAANAGVRRTGRATEDGARWRMGFLRVSGERGQVGRGSRSKDATGPSQVAPGGHGPATDVTGVNVDSDGYS